jgi:hypothetical protein
LALYALASTRQWGGGDVGDLHLRAARFNHGLTPRDSLLIVTESLRTAAVGYDTAYWTHLRRMINAASSAREGNGEDPEPWLVLGDLLFHYDYVVPASGAPIVASHSPFPVSNSSKEVREAFDRAIELDSGFAAAYIHPIELAGTPTRARPYITAYLEASGPEGGSSGIRLLERLIHPGGTNLARLLDSADTGVLREVVDLTSTWQDSGEVALHLARLYVARRRPELGSEAWLPDFLAKRLAYRGHLKEARVVLDDRVGETFAGLALLGAIPPDTASVVAELWHREPESLIGDPWPRHISEVKILATPAIAMWWAERGDISRLRALSARADSMTRTFGPACKRNCDSPIPPDVAFLRATPDLVRATLALARRDTAEALSGLLALPDSAVAHDWRVRLLKFRLLAATGNDRDAIREFDPRILPPLSPLWVLGMLERGRISERRGEREKATECYQFVVDVWRHADPELQRHVSEAREGLARLATN